MEYKIHTVNGEEKLSSIAEKYNTTPEAIKVLNPKMRTFIGFIGGVFVAHGQQIKIPIIEKSSEIQKENLNFLNNLEFKKQARYRFKQTNVVKFENTPVSNSMVRAQYLFQIQDNIVHNQLEESHYSMQPQSIYLEDFLSLSDKVRNSIYFEINQEGKPLKILNMNKLKQSWESCKSNEIPNNEFMKSVKQQSSVKYKEIINAGDKEFNNMKFFLKNLENNLYFKEIFGQYLTKSFEDFKDENYKTISNFFKETIIEANLKYSKVSEEGNFITFRKVSELNRDKINEMDMIRQYDEMYKPNIKYNFSEYNYSYRVTSTINKEDELLDNIHITLFEKIKNNLSCSVNFELKRIEL